MFTKQIRILQIYNQMLGNISALIVFAAIVRSAIIAQELNEPPVKLALLIGQCDRTDFGTICCAHMCLWIVYIGN